MRRRRGEVYALGQLVMIATHSPKKFPRPDAFLDRRPAPRSSDDEVRAYFRARIAAGKRRKA